MQFLFPGFLWALLAIAVPIIIHLFYFRRFKKVYFTNVKFLKELKEETSTRSKLKNLLILLSRIAAISLLVFAFAQPFIPLKDDIKKGQKAVSVFIDNSFSMSALSEDVPLMEQAKKHAREIIAAMPVEDRFQILTNDFQGRQQRLVSKEDALAMIDEIKVSPEVKNLSKVLFRQKEVLNTAKTENKIAYIISDFQKNITDFQDFADTTIDVNLIPLQSVKERNISIDSAWFDAPVQMVNQTNPLMIKVSNRSNDAVENIRLSLQLEDQTKPVGTFSIAANTSITDTVNISILKTGWHSAALQITDYPIQFDDKYYFTFDVAKEINVLAISDFQHNRSIRAAFEGAKYFKVTEQLSQKIDYSKLVEYQFIILDGLKTIPSGLASELSDYVHNGGSLLCFPNREADITAYNNFLKEIPANELMDFEEAEKKVGRINTDEFVFKNVYINRRANLRLPVTKGSFKTTRLDSQKEEALSTYRDGSSFLSKYVAGTGHFYFCNAPLDEQYSNLTQSGEIFVPMMLKMAISSPTNKKAAYFIGKDEVIDAENRISNQEMVYKLRGEDNEFIPEQRVIGSKVLLGLNGQIQKAGYYDLFLKENETLAKYGFNYDRKESDLTYLNTEDLQQINPEFNIISAYSSANFGEIIEAQNQGIIYWRWALILALLFLLLEALIIRLF